MKNHPYYRNVAAALGLLAVIIAGRLLPHLPNFTPVAAVALFGGFLFRSRAASIAVVASGMFITDLFFGFYDFGVMLAVYGCMLLPCALGSFLNKRVSIARVGILSIASSIAFFVITNFAVWMFSGMYPQTAAGLAACYVAALPFAGFTIAGDLFWNSALFGTYFAARHLKSLRQVRAGVPLAI